MKKDSLYIISIIQSILKNENIQSNREEIYQMLLSDKSYPSILSIINTLKIWGVNCNAYQADYKSLVENEGYKIVHTTDNEGHFYLFENRGENVLLNDGEKNIISQQEFFQRWDGIIAIAERKIKKNIAWDRYTILKKILISLFLIGLVYTMKESFNDATLLMLNLAGIFVSLIVVSADYHEYKDIPFCYINERFNCKEVHKHNPLAKINNVSFAFLPLLYFLYYTIQEMTNSYHTPIVYFFTSIALVTSLVMVGYQSIVIRKYCTLCLSISLIISIEFVLTFSSNTNYTNEVKGDLVSLVLAIILCFLIKERFKVDRDLISTKIFLSRFKRNKEIFRFLLKQSEPIRVSTFCMEFGEYNSENVIHTFLQPNCVHCKKIIEEMTTLILFHKNIKWLISLSGINSDDNDSFIRYNHTQLQILQTYKENKENTLQLLFHEKKCDKLNITDETVEIFRQQLKDINELRLKYLPLVSFNGRKLPWNYQISDLNFYL